MTSKSLLSSFKPALRLAAAALLALALQACGEKKDASPTGGGSGPAWMNKGSGAVATGRGRTFQGVGVAAGKSAALRRRDADAAAKGELASVVSAFNAKLAKAAAPSDAAQEAQVLAGLNGITPAARVVDHYVSGDGNESALAIFDLESYKAGIDKASIAAELKEAVKGSADAIFDTPDEPKA
jgi:hypothetical protein